MLYNTFKVALLISSALGVMYMYAENSLEYAYLPIFIILWVLYDFFKNVNNKHLRRICMEQDDKTYYYGGFSADGCYKPNNTKNHTHINHSTTKPYSNPIYKKIANKCKRNFKITIDNDISLGNGIKQIKIHGI